jgi:hypothetical protein
MFSFDDPAFLGSLSIYDPNALAYIMGVEIADGAELEPGVRTAINNFVIGCKADGIWYAIKACCILAGARTLAGALVPLVGSAPTNFNFVPPNYNRKTGLLGNGTTTYLGLNRTVNEDPQNDRHISLFPTAVSGSGIRAGVTTRVSNLALTAYINAANDLSLQICGGDVNIARPFAANYLVGGSRSNATQIIARTNGANSTHANNSVTPITDEIFMYANGRGAFFNPSRFAFYSIGEYLNLALLDARVTTLINAFGAAIP